MRGRLKTIATCLAGLVCLAVPAAAHAEDEFEKYDIKSAAAELSTTQAGAHPDFTAAFLLSEKEGTPYATTRNVIVTLPPGLFGNPQAFPQCTAAQFGTGPFGSSCPQDAQIGVAKITIGGGVKKTFFDSPIYNMPPLGGDEAARFGFYGANFPNFINVRVDPETHALVASAENSPSAELLVEAVTTFWGVPANPVHNPERLTPAESVEGSGAPNGGRESNLTGEVPFMTNPTSCENGRTVTFSAESYQVPGIPRTITVPFPQITGCGGLDFSPSTSLKPTTTQATSPSGLEYGLELPTLGLRFSNLNYGSELKRAEVVLPEGLSINPSEAEGLGVCSEADLAREAYNSPPNVGCPETSKIGSVIAETPVLDRNIEGSLYLAKPYENPFGSLLALYMVLKVPDRGVLVKIPGEVRLDPVSGQITTVFDEIPQLPVAHFHLNFREGARAPLATPYACGSYEAISNMSPWASPSSVSPRGNSFAIESGPDHGPCPTGGLPPFKPGLIAGMLNNAAGSYSPFDLRLYRTDAEQEITHFSIKLPPGLVAKLAGIPFCPDAAIAAAKGRTGIHGGEEELALPSCPAASQIGTTLVGSGVGTALVYVPGKVYLAGPYNGSPLSIVAVTAAKAGPFDLGTVVVREALRVNPETAEVFVDATGSDPIPHIIEGVPVHLRDIRVYVDRPEFALNPTDCSPTSTASTVRGAGLDFVSEADDNPVTVATRFQAADCAALGFKPQLKLQLKGGTKRNQVPALRAVLHARKGDANISQAEVILPHSEFLEQGHIGTVCTRAQFAAGAGNGAQCPAGSIYGRARAVTPLLSEPLEGPVFLRSNGGERSLPDLVAALHGQEINIDLVGYIDSVSEKNKNGEVISRIRNRFATVPDAPVTKFVLEMRGGKKGLLVNSTNICRGKHLADANFSGQNAREHDFRPALQAKCGHRGAGKKRVGKKKGHR
jgi:hypothetical protein